MENTKPQEGMTTPVTTPTTNQAATSVTTTTPPADQNPADPKPSESAGGIETLPEWAQKLIREVRTEAAAHRTALREAERAAKAAEEARLAEQGEYKKLAEDRAQRVAELEPVAQEVEALRVKVEQFEKATLARIAAEIAEWPEGMRAVVEKARDVEEKAAVVEHLRSAVAELAKAKGSGSPGNQADPKAAVAREPVAAPVRVRF